MTNRATDSTEDLGTHALFVGMSEEYMEGVVSSVIEHLGRASPDSRRAFEGELDRQNLRIPGFRSASRAPANLLARPVQAGVLISDELAAVALRLWAESNRGLREAISERLNDIGAYIGVSADFPDSDEKQLIGHWPGEIWERERSRFARLLVDADESDVELMMCYVSGRLPAAGESEDNQDNAPDAVDQHSAIVELLEKCAVDLEYLPVSAPEWDSAVPDLAERIAEIVGAKREERGRAATLDSFIEEIRNDFSTELAFLEFDTTSWSAGSLPTGEDVARALGMCEELRLTLAELRAVRESAPGVTRSAERERRDRNDELEDEALGRLDRIGRLMSGDPMPDDDPPGRSARGEEQTGNEAKAEHRDTSENMMDSVPESLGTFPVFDSEQLYRENLSLQSDNDSLGREKRELQDENTRLEGENDSMRSENRMLTNQVEFLRADNSDIKRELQEAQSKLAERESDTEYWRASYEEEARKPKLTVEEVPQQVEDVNDVVMYAQTMFEDTMLLKLNSKSGVQDNPFVKPKDVWDALEWLATTYHGARSGKSSVPDFDISLREACGWQYRSGQGQTTLNKYKEWYTTKVNGKTYWLAEHMAKGASKDARHTIRIAFDWDNDEKVVVVGYIGQHQETDAT